MILMLIFLLQSIWLYISELAGKDLEIDVIFKFLLYVSPRLIVLVLPLTILLASIMVFGNFAENYEFAAMKSTGISLQRAMRSLAIFIGVLSITTFFFANNVIPWAEFNFYNLRKNLAKVKPAMVIAEGQFNEIGDINIKVEKKSGDRGQYLEDVVIHKKKANRSGNYTVIKSKTGELTSSEDSDILQLVLYDGNYYDALQPKDVKERRRNPHVKSSFERYTLNVDLSEMNDVDMDEKKYDSRHNMLTAKELDITIDTLLIQQKVDYDVLIENMYNRSSASTLNLNIEPKKTDSTFTGESIYELFQPRKNIQLIDAALNSLRSTQAIMNSKKRTLAAKDKNLNKHVISFYDKYALGLTCIILFFVGAPLGALIRKGGFGLPIVIAIVLFLTYHFIGIFAKNSAEDGSINPAFSSWLSTLIMLPLSIYLTDRATKDRSLVSFDWVLDPIHRLLAKKDDDSPLDTSIFDTETEEYRSLKNYKDKKLIDIIQNYRQYDMSVRYKNTALSILNERGTTEQELRFGGKLTNENYETALRYKFEFDNNSRTAMVLYIVYVVFGVGGLVLANNGFSGLGYSLFGIGVVSVILFLFALMKAYNSQTNFYKLLGPNKGTNIIILILLGIPLYFLYNLYVGRRMKEDIKRIR